MNLAGHTLRYRFRRPETLRFFQHYLRPAEEEQFHIAVSNEDMEYARSVFKNHTDVYLEIKYLIDLTARHLLQFDACIIHAAAFIWKGYAWLLVAPSGTGKSTQLARWRLSRGAEIQVICGDMPVVSTQLDGTIKVWPSPWNGKEGWGSMASAPLGGTIFLEQAQKNTIERIEPHLSVPCFFGQLACVPETQEQIYRLAALVERLARNYPVWILKNKGDQESTALTVDTLSDYLSKGSGKL